MSQAKEEPEPIGSINLAQLTQEQANRIYDQGREAVVKILCELSKQVIVHQSQIGQLQEEVRRLKEQIAKDSHNSSKPPSSDEFQKPSVHSLRPPSERKTGGQEGHQGNTLKMVDKPDKIIIHRVDKCQKCGSELANKETLGIEKRQVFDIPPIKLEVTEHQAQIKMCPNCQDTSKAQFPEDVSAPAQYGLRLKSLWVYLMCYQLLPYERTCELLRDIFSCNVSEGTLANTTQSCSESLQPVLNQIKQEIIKSPVVNFDETGACVNGKRQWMHVASTARLTHYQIHPKRGSEAMNENGILNGYKGRSIHDFWKPYFKFSCTHGLCNAHHLRELTFLYEEQGQQWAKDMIECLVGIKKAVDQAKSLKLSSLSAEKINEFESRYDEILKRGYSQNPLAQEALAQKKRGKQKQSKARNLLRRLDEHAKEVLAFMYDFDVPFDNNQAERDIRMVKVHNKISGTFRSYNGAQIFCNIRSYISTARKNTVNIIEAIHNVFTGAPFVPMTSGP